MAGPLIYSAAVIGFLVLCAVYATGRRRRLPLLGLDDSKARRTRRKPFNDPGRYAEHGDWPFVPSDLLKSSRFHDERK